MYINPTMVTAPFARETTRHTTNSLMYNNRNYFTTSSQAGDRFGLNDFFSHFFPIQGRTRRIIIVNVHHARIIFDRFLGFIPKKRILFTVYRYCSQIIPTTTYRRIVVIIIIVDYNYGYSYYCYFGPQNTEKVNSTHVSRTVHDIRVVKKPFALT